jgi:purine-binding chemotaxis protein CheW
MNAMTAAFTSNSKDDLVTFEMGGEVIAVSTRVLREVIEPPRITPVPLADIHSPGLMNNRGVVLPVADLRPLFGMEPKPFDSDTRIMVMQLDLDAGPLTVGVIAEMVHAVITLDAETVQSVPELGSRWPAYSVTGIGRWNGRFVHVVDVERLFETHLGLGSGHDGDEA